jgi:hypothetical protein
MTGNFFFVFVAAKAAPTAHLLSRGSDPPAALVGKITGFLRAGARRIDFLRGRIILKVIAKHPAASPFRVERSGPWKESIRWSPKAGKACCP